MITSHRIQSLEYGLRALAKLVTWRMAACFHKAPQTSQDMPQELLTWPGLDDPLSRFILKHDLSHGERVVLLLALVPHLQPDFLDRLIMAQLPQDGDYPTIGGWRGKTHRGFLPTGETVLFLIGGDSLAARLEIQQIFSGEHLFSQRQVLSLDPPAMGEPTMSGKLIMSQDAVELFTQGRYLRPQLSIRFPAQRVTTAMEWEDLVLNGKTFGQIREVEAWLIHGQTLLETWGMKKQLKLGYRALFYGPPGTGKTLTASLLGKYTGRDVYRIDISMVVSKFIGETEKNLANLFDRAKDKNWILFFDEADALFGKRTNVQDAHDRYANQEVSYLLQRIEEYSGLVILASNLMGNMDDAFKRRIQSIIHFPMPTSRERERLWAMAFPKQISLAEDVSLSELAATYELTGADILNVVQHCCLKALQRDRNTVSQEHIFQAVRREFSKTGKIL